MALYNRSNVDPWNNLKEVLLKIGKINQKLHLLNQVLLYVLCVASWFAASDSVEQQTFAGHRAKGLVYNVIILQILLSLLRKAPRPTTGELRDCLVWLYNLYGGGNQ
jgi:hypothetical protein